MDADVEATAHMHSGPVDEDPPVPHMFPALFKEEEAQTELPEHDVSQPEDADEEAPIQVLNRFVALRIVHVDGLRRMPSV